MRSSFLLCSNKRRMRWQAGTCVFINSSAFWLPSADNSCGQLECHPSPEAAKREPARGEKPFHNRGCAALCAPRSSACNPTKQESCRDCQGLPQVTSTFSSRHCLLAVLSCLRKAASCQYSKGPMRQHSSPSLGELTGEIFYLMYLKTENLWSEPNQNQFVVFGFLTRNCWVFKKAPTVHQENFRKTPSVFTWPVRNFHDEESA